LLPPGHVKRAIRGLRRLRENWFRGRFERFASPFLQSQSTNHHHRAVSLLEAPAWPCTKPLPVRCAYWYRHLHTRRTCTVPTYAVRTYCRHPPGGEALKWVQANPCSGAGDSLLRVSSLHRHATSPSLLRPELYLVPLRYYRQAHASKNAGLPEGTPKTMHDQSKNLKYHSTTPVPPFWYFEIIEPMSRSVAIRTRPSRTGLDD